MVAFFSMCSGSESVIQNHSDDGEPKGTDESNLVTDSLASLMHKEPSDLVIIDPDTEMNAPYSSLLSYLIVFLEPHGYF